jgi:hypothetical protein
VHYNPRVTNIIHSRTGEFVYHMNIRTPEWLGYFIQRPESHRVHHLRDSQVCRIDDEEGSPIVHVIALQICRLQYLSKKTARCQI